MAATRLAVWEAVTSPWADSCPSGRLKVATDWDWLSAPVSKVMVATRWAVPTLLPSRNSSRVRMLWSPWLGPGAPRSRVVDWMVTAASRRVLALEAEAAWEGRATAATSASASRATATRPVRARSAMVDTGTILLSWGMCLTHATVGGWAAGVVPPVVAGGSPQGWCWWRRRQPLGGGRSAC